MRRVHAVILAAGASQRLGFPKALARFGRRTALQIAVENSKRAGLGRSVVVLGHAAEFLRPYAAELGVSVVVNRSWKRGQLDSFRAGLRRLGSSANGFMLYPIDYPLVTASILRSLLRAMERRRDHDIFCPFFRRHGGHPVLFRGRLRSEFLRLGPRQTARDVVYRDPDRVGFVPIRSNAHRTDFDTPEQYRRLRLTLRAGQAPTS